MPRKFSWIYQQIFKMIVRLRLRWKQGSLVRWPLMPLAYWSKNPGIRRRHRRLEARINLTKVFPDGATSSHVWTVETAKLAPGCIQKIRDALEAFKVGEVTGEASAILPCCTGLPNGRVDSAITQL